MGNLGSRFSKLFLEISKDTTVLELSLRAILAANVCRGLVVVTREQEVEKTKELLAKLNPEIETQVVIGGATRQESVWNGLCAVADKAKFVLIHDAARPLCSPELIRSVAEVGMRTSAAILATPAISTLKQVDLEHKILRTIPRADVWEAQTPQVFDFELIHGAHLHAMENKHTGTDDSELVELFGQQVSIVEGSRANVKITRAEDFEFIRGAKGDFCG